MFGFIDFDHTVSVYLHLKFYETLCILLSNKSSFVPRKQHELYLNIANEFTNFKLVFLSNQNPTLRIFWHRNVARNKDIL